MHRVIGYTETGAKIWSDNQPSAATISGHRGSLVTGESRPAKGAGLTACQMHPESVRKPRATMGRPRLPSVPLHHRGKVYATEEQRIAARRQSWRESANRKRDRLRAERTAA